MYGAHRGSRTPDLPLTRRLLYQLSYAGTRKQTQNRSLLNYNPPFGAKHLVVTLYALSLAAQSRGEND